MRLIRLLTMALMLTVAGAARAQEPRLFEQPAARGAVELEVIRPIADVLEPGTLARLKTVGPTRWTVYEPADLQVVVESDRSLLFAAPIASSRVVVFASVQAEGPPIFQPFILHVRGVTPPPPIPPTPTPDPPGPTPPTPVPVPDDVPNQLGLGKVAYTQAMAVNSPSRAAEAKGIAAAFRQAAATADSGSATIAQIWTALLTATRAAAGSNRDKWSAWEASVFGAIKDWQDARKPVALVTWSAGFLEIAAAMERVPQ
jgi:hypothetical protein